MTENNVPKMDVPMPTDIVLSGDTAELAKNMTDEEMKALVIMTFRMTQEIVGFVRDVAKALDAAQNAPGIGGMMARQMIPPNMAGMVPPVGIQPNRAQRRHPNN